MPEITCDLSDSQFASLEQAAARTGMSIEELAHRAVESAVAARYGQREVSGNVVSLEALKSRLRGPPKS